MNKTVEKFTDVTGYDLLSFLGSFYYFVDNLYMDIVQYYQGKSSVNKESFKALNDLMLESSRIEEIIALNKSTLSSSIEFWELVEHLSEINGKLNTISQMAKWLRSSYVFGYENQTKVKEILGQNQTLENLSYNLGASDSNEDWVDIAITNALREIDYTKEGGNQLSVQRTDNKGNNVTTVVDIMVGDNILGKDLSKKLTFADDDLLTLGTTETLEQSAEICLTTVKGSVPEFLYLGIPKVFVGTNINTMRVSSLIREVVNNFRTDDSFKNVELINAGIEQDVSFYEFKILSRLNTELNKVL